MPEETGTAKGFAGTSETVTITVGPNNTITVDKNTIRLRKGPKDEASWQRRGDTGEFKISFEDPSPFPQRTYDHNTAKHLTPRPDARETTYKYIVQVPGCNDLDPELIVDQ